jgi:hypothetical protein
MKAGLPLAGRWRACRRRSLGPCVHGGRTERQNNAVGTILYYKNRLYCRHHERKTALVWQEEHGMATRPKRSRTARAGPKTSHPEETTPRKKAGRPPGPPSTIINLRIPVALVARLDRYIDYLEAHTGLKAHRGMIARRALELFLETYEPG